ncbi:MAG: hypothetical protein OEZ13_00095 [Spirochaetia bacterium]|nr:hypothetical protein [Spirochaetia bacterium]
MKNTITKLIRFTLILILIFGISNLAFAQRGRKAKVQEQEQPTNDAFAEEKIEQEAKDEEPIDFMKDLKPRAGIYLSPVIPMGTLGDSISTGFGFGLHADVLFPLSFLKALNLELRTGLFFAYSSFSGNVDLTIEGTTDTVPYAMAASIMPLIVYANVGFPMKALGLTPYGSIGTGVTFSSAHKTVDPDSESLVIEEDRDVKASSVDGAFNAAAGVLYSNPALPYLDLGVQLRYIVSVQKLSGHFFQADVTVSYSFDSSGSSGNNAASQETEVSSESVETK